MSESKSNLEAAAEALPLVEAYEDLLQPAAKEIGKNLETVAKLVTVALTPLRLAIWGGEKIEAWLVPSLAERLEDVPPDRLVSPNPLIAGPAIEALRFAGTEETLRELYANLLATSMDASTAHNAHPAFVEVLKQLTPDEAKILGVIFTYLSDDMFWTGAAITVRANIASSGGFTSELRHFSFLAEYAGCTNKELIPSYIDNMSRLGLLEVREDWEVSGSDDIYVALERHELVRAKMAEISALAPEQTPSVERESLILTQFGTQFLRACGMPVDPSDYPAGASGPAA